MRDRGRERHSTQIEAYQLPHGIQAQAAGHHRVAFKVASENHKSGLITSNSAMISPLPYFTAIGVDGNDAVDHQHIGQRQLGVAGAEHLPRAHWSNSSFGVAALRNVLGSHGCP